MRSVFVARIFSTLCLCAALPAYTSAATITVTAVNFASGNKTVTDPYTTGATATTQTNVSAATPALTQFDPATGVLTGTALSVTSSRQQTLSGSASKASGIPTTTATFAGNSTANITAPGVNNTFSSISQSTSCMLSGNPARTCTPATQNGTVTTSGTFGVAAADLNAYVGTGTVGATLTLPQVQSNLTATNALNGGSSIYTVSWSGTLDATYTYLLHAAPSFDDTSSLTSLTLDFGTLYQNDAAAPLNFSLFNPSGDRTDVNLTGIAGTGDTSVLGTDLSLFNNLLQGDHVAFSALFDTSQIGNFAAAYTLSLEDFMPSGAASSTKQTYSLQLNLTGNVVAPQPAVVPLPASAWLFLSALAGLGGIRRRIAS
jgi:hypothetical protein